jgi:hypothetical protein
LAGLNCTPHGIGGAWSSSHPDSSSTTAVIFTTAGYFTTSIWSHSTVGESLLTSGSDSSCWFSGELCHDQILDGDEILVSLDHGEFKGFSVCIVCRDLASDDQISLGSFGGVECTFSGGDSKDGSIKIALGTASLETLRAKVASDTLAWNTQQGDLDGLVLAVTAAEGALDTAKAA